MKILSLFDGISVGRLALERLGINVGRYVAYEIDKYAITISKKNYPDIEHMGDVFEGDYTEYKDFDLLIGGSPCTHWSIARRNRETTSEGLGFELFMQYVRALKESGCKWFLYENNHSIHKDIKNAISEKLGVQPIMINSALLSAQQRKRWYWTNIPNIVQPKDKGILLKDILETGLPWQDKSHCMTSSYNGAVIWNTLERKQRTMVAEPFSINKPVKVGSILGGGQGNRIYSVYGKAVAQTAQSGGLGSNTGLYVESLPFNTTTDGKAQCIRSTIYKDGIRNLIGNDVDRRTGVAEPVIIQTAHGYNQGGIKTDKAPTLTANGSWQQNNKLICTDELVPYTLRKIETIVKKYGYLPEMFNPYNNSEITDKAPTFTASSGSRQTSSGTVFVIQKMQEEISEVLGRKIYVVLDGEITIKGKTYPIKLPNGFYIIRKLTPIECERLQTLDDGFTEGVSDTQRYKAIGNGWTCDVISHILSFIPR